MWLDIIWILLIACALYLGYILEVGYYGKLAIAIITSLLASLLLGGWIIQILEKNFQYHDARFSLAIYLSVAIIWNLLTFKLYKYLDANYNLTKLGVVNKIVSAGCMVVIFSLCLAHLVEFAKESDMIAPSNLESSLTSAYLNKIPVWTDKIFSSSREVIHELKERTEESFD